MYLQTIPVGSLETNCYLLCDKGAKVCAVIDPGAEPEKILSAVEKTGCALSAVYLTHGHSDHTGAADAMRGAASSIPIYLNHRDIWPADNAAARRIFHPVTNPTDYDEGDVLTLGSLSIRVLATPGHTAGGVTLLCGDALFCGDTLFAGSMGRTDFPGGSDRDMLASLARLANLPGDYRVLPGHMQPSTLARERASNPYLRMALNRQA